VRLAPAGTLTVYGTRGDLSVDYGGAYTCFRNHILELVKGLAGVPCLDFEKTGNVVGTLIAGQESPQSGGRRMRIRPRP